MGEKVAIVGAAQSKYEGKKWNYSEGELIRETIEKALKETGLDYQDKVTSGYGVDKIISVVTDVQVLRAVATMYISPYMGVYNLDENSVEAEGIQAIYQGVMNILSGYHNVVLVIAYRFESIHGHRNIMENQGLDPIYMRPLGLDSLSAGALQAKRYMYKYGITPEQCARAVVRDRGNAKNNPYAQEPLDLSVEDVLNSKMVAYPLRSLDCKPTSDGACVVILASEEAAKTITDKPVWIKGVGNCYDAHYLGDRDLADCDSLVEAARQAYAMAGISDPLHEIDVAEISAEYSYQDLLWMEGLGFCDRGEGGKLITEGVTEMNGRLPVNPSGGMLNGNPVTVAGATRVAEAFLQLRGEAGDRQVDGAATAMAHGMYGPCGQVQHVIILGK